MFKTVQAADFKENPFLRKNNWALLGASHGGETNALTVSWGMIGFLWEKPVLTAFVRPQRHTSTLILPAETFSLSFFSEDYKKILGYMGSSSGAAEDKIAKSGLTCRPEQGAPVFEEAELVFLCKKLYVGRFAENEFIETSIIERTYPQRDFHRTFFGEILSVLVKE